jgi:hypothetical protein
MSSFARWFFGAESPCPGQGSDFAIEHTAAWPAWVTLAFLLAAAAFVIVTYAKERRGVSRWVKGDRRGGGHALRLAAAALLH